MFSAATFGFRRDCIRPLANGNKSASTGVRGGHRRHWGCTGSIHQRGNGRVSSPGWHSLPVSLASPRPSLGLDHSYPHSPVLYPSFLLSLNSRRATARIPRYVLSVSRQPLGSLTRPLSSVSLLASFLRARLFSASISPSKARNLRAGNRVGVRSRKDSLGRNLLRTNRILKTRVIIERAISAISLRNF